MALRLALFYAAVFGFVGISLPFWPVWLTDKGLDAFLSDWRKTGQTILQG